MIYGVAAYSIVRNTDAEAKAELARITDVKQSAAGYHNYQQWIAGTQLEQRVSLEDYSVSNRGLRSGLIGTPQQVLDRVKAFESAGVNLLLLQCSPQLEEMERFAEEVIRAVALSGVCVAAERRPSVARGGASRRRAQPLAGVDGGAHTPARGSAPLHPWLHSVVPPGLQPPVAAERRPTVARGEASRRRAQPLAGVDGGRTRPPGVPIRSTPGYTRSSLRDSNPRSRGAAADGSQGWMSQRNPWRANATPGTRANQTCSRGAATDGSQG